MSVCVIAITAILVFALANRPMDAFSGMFVSDPFSVFFKFLILISVAMALFMSRDYLVRHNVARRIRGFGAFRHRRHDDDGFRRRSDEPLSGLELQSLSLYVIAAFRGISAPPRRV